MRILVATNHLNSLGGTETYTYALIAELKSRNFEVQYFTFQKGLVSDKIEKDLDVNFMSYGRYDLILANHNTCVNELYSKGSIIQTCHGIYPKLEQPSPRADFYVAISKEVKNHLRKLGYLSIVILNGVDCTRFSLKNEPDTNLKKILSLSQSVEVNKLLKKISKENNWELQTINKFEDKIWEIELVINDVDLVIGLGRSAFEAMACGRPVVIYDHRPYSEPYGDGYLTKEKLDESIKNNCSGRRFKKNFSEEKLREEIKKYSAEDGKDLRAYAHLNLNIQTKPEQYFRVYNDYLISFHCKYNFKKFYFLIESQARYFINRIFTIGKKVKEKFL